MTFEEALKALREGKKVRNKIWEEHEYIMIKNGFIKYGNGVTHRIDIYGEYDILDDTWEEYKEPVLDEKEKEYLSAVIKPFKNRITYIKKVYIHRGYNKNYEYIFGELGNEDVVDTFTLPYFSKETMYKGMETDKKYTLEELGL